MDFARAAARRMPAMKPVGKPDAGNPHVRFDERGGETGRLGDTAPLLDSTGRHLLLAQQRRANVAGSDGAVEEMARIIRVQTDICDRLLDDPSPMHKARHRPFGATLVNLHTVRQSPYLRQTSGLSAAFG